MRHPLRESAADRCDRTLVVRSGGLSAVRAGATLTEVLMSLLIMSVGVLSVMSLFPISLLRTIQAAATTNASLLTGNATEELLARSELLDGVPYWQPGQRYQPGALVTPLPPPGQTNSGTNRIFLVPAAYADGSLVANVGPTIVQPQVQPDWNRLRFNPLIPNSDVLAIGSPLNANAVFPEAPFGTGGAVSYVDYPWREIFPETAGTPASFGRVAAAIETYVSPTTSVATPGGTVPAASIPEAYANRTTVYVVDPLGWVQRRIEDEEAAAAAGNPPTYTTDFGFGPTYNFATGGATYAGGPDGYGGLARFDAGLRIAPLTFPATGPPIPAVLNDSLTRTQRLGLANNLVGLPDSYDEIGRIEQITGVTYSVDPATGFGYMTLALPPAFVSANDLVDFAADTGVTGGGRLVINSPDGTRSFALPIEAPGGAAAIDVNARTITVRGSVGVAGGLASSDFPRPSAGFVDTDGNGEIGINEIGVVSIQNYQPQFTFLVVVRKDARGNALRSVVVFFNRSLDPADERPTRASFGGGFDADDSGTLDTGEPALGDDEVLVQWNGGGETKPLLQVGNWFLDADEGFFYQIKEIVEEPALGGTGIPNSALLRVDRPLRTRHGIGRPAASASLPDQGHAVFMPGIVRVFEQGLGE